ncbi:MAG: helix-turn-helix domain-containing protein [Draconibacterium sp.]
MESLYLATSFAAAITCLLTSVLVFARRKSGERSRVILACIVLLLAASYIQRFIVLSQGEVPKSVLSVPMLLVANFLMISYMMYPIEVISPGYLNLRRIFRFYSPLLLLAAIYNVMLKLGITFPHYHSLPEMLPQFTQFHVWFRFLLAILMFAPLLFIYFVPYTRRYNNTNKTWILKYTICIIANILVYMLLLTFDLLVIKVLYYSVTVGCSIYIAYMELFERLIEQGQELKVAPHGVTVDEISFREELPAKPNQLCERIVLYMNRTSDYRDPDISVNTLAASIGTNRTSLSNALHELGYTSFNDYINTLRIKDFIHRIENKESDNYQNAFYDVGFRSRATALRNFKQYTGKTPSEYFAH